MQTEQRWELGAVLLLCVRLLICLAAGMLAIALLQKLGPRLPLAQQRFSVFAISALSFQGAGLVLTHWLIREHGRAWGEFLGWARPHAGRAALLGLAIGTLALPGIQLLSEISVILLTLVQGKPELQSTVQVMQLTVSPMQRLGFGLGALFLAPVSEEILFRGILYRLLCQFGWPRLAVIASSILFGVIHFNPVALVPLSYFALILALLYEKTDNLLAPILAHATFNAVNYFSILFPHS